MRVLLAGVLAVGCAAGGGAPTTETHAARAESAAVEAAAEVPSLLVWAADAELKWYAQDASRRIQRTSGVVVSVLDDYGGVPLFRSDVGAQDEWLGHMHADHAARPKWMAVEESAPPELVADVVLHEILHSLGAEHVGEGEGVLSPRLWTGRAWRLTEADLVSLCSEQACSMFSAE